MDDLKKELIEASQRQIEAYAMQPFTIVAPRGVDESQEDYAQRCQALANAILNTYSKKRYTALTFDSDSHTGITQVGEHAYEIETPGHHSQEEPRSERDTHFLDFARLLWEELSSIKSLDYNSDEYDKFVQRIAHFTYDHLPPPSELRNLLHD